MARQIVLASASPRRSLLLREAGIVFEVSVPDVEEAYDTTLTCEALTIENARRKAVAGSRQHPDALVIGADTLVYIDGHPLSKPADMSDARRMLRRLSGKTHQVCTGVALASNAGAEVTTFATITDVTFKTIDDAVITAYHTLVNVLDKAGGYAVQEHGDLIVKCVDGSMSNVIGLPMEALHVQLSKLHED